jgi:hypothetical protein
LVSDDADNMFCDRHHLGQFLEPGSIAHLNFPFNYTEKQMCFHRIYIPATRIPSWQICFSFRRFVLEDYSEPGFGDYLEFPGQLKFYGNGSRALNFSAAPPQALPVSDPRSNIFYKNLCCKLHLLICDIMLLDNTIRY